MSEQKQYVPADAKDRERFAKQSREDRQHKQKMKDERFAAIRERRKNNPSGGRGGSNINIRVNSD